MADTNNPANTDCPQSDNASHGETTSASHPDADPRLDQIYRRISKGDTSVVSEVYWLQLLD